MSTDKVSARTVNTTDQPYTARIRVEGDGHEHSSKTASTMTIEKKWSPRPFGASETVDPSDPYTRRTETFPRLTPDQAERVVAFGVVQPLARGTALFECGDRRVDFFLVLDGFVEVYESRGTAERVLYTHQKHQFTGELTIFNDRAVIVSARMGADGSVARLSPPQFRRLLAAEPDIANVVMRACILRRDGLILHGHTAVQIIAPRRQAESLQLQQFLTRNRHPYLLAHPEVDPEAASQLAELGLTIDDTPVVLIGGGRAVVSPTARELGDTLGIAESLHPGHVADVVVVGAGRRALPRPCIRRRKASTRSLWKPMPQEVRPRQVRASRTTWVSLRNIWRRLSALCPSAGPEVRCTYRRAS